MFRRLFVALGGVDTANWGSDEGRLKESGWPKCHWMIPCDVFFGFSRILSGTLFLKNLTSESTHLPTMYRPATTGADCCHILEVFEHLDVHRSFAEKLTPLRLLKGVGRKRRRRFVAGSSWLKSTSWQRKKKRSNKEEDRLLDEELEWAWVLVGVRWEALRGRDLTTRCCMSRCDQGLYECTWWIYTWKKKY